MIGVTRMLFSSEDKERAFVGHFLFHTRFFESPSGKFCAFFFVILSQGIVNNIVIEKREQHAFLFLQLIFTGAKLLMKILEMGKRMIIPAFFGISFFDLIPIFRH